MLKGFRDFVLRGNVVDLAVGVVIGAAFGAVVASFTKDILTPLIAAVVGKPDFGALAITLNNSKITYGLFLNAVIAFLLVATAIYFGVVMPMNTVMARLKKEEPAAAATTKKCVECLMDIPMEARRCAHCASVQASSASA